MRLLAGVLLVLSLKAGVAEDWRTAGMKAQQHLYRTEYAEAAEAAKQALSLSRNFGHDDTRVGSSYYLLGVIHREWGHCPEARTDFRSALAIWGRQPVRDVHHISRAAAGLISVLAECDDFPAAEKAFRTYEADLRSGAVAPGDRAQLLSLRGTIARGRKRYAEAASLFEQALQVLESNHGSPMEIMVVRNSLSVAYTRVGRSEDALRESEAAAAFFEHSKPMQPSYVAALNNAACVLANLKRLDQSAGYFQRALDAAMQLYGEDNYIVARIMLNYARVLRENHESPAAATWRKRGEAAYQRSLLHSTQVVDVHDLSR